MGDGSECGRLQARQGAHRRKRAGEASVVCAWGPVAGGGALEAGGFLATPLSVIRGGWNYAIRSGPEEELKKLVFNPKGIHFPS